MARRTQEGYPDSSRNSSSTENDKRFNSATGELQNRRSNWHVNWEQLVGKYFGCASTRTESWQSPILDNWQLHLDFVDEHNNTYHLKGLNLPAPSPGRKAVFGDPLRGGRIELPESENLFIQEHPLEHNGGGHRWAEFWFKMPLQHVKGTVTLTMFDVRQKTISCTSELTGQWSPVINVQKLMRQTNPRNRK